MMISFITLKNLHPLKSSTMLLNLPIIYRNNLDSGVPSQILKRLIGGGKPNNLFQNSSKVFNPKNNAPFHPSPKNQSSPQSITTNTSSTDPLQIDSKLPDNFYLSNTPSSSHSTAFSTLPTPHKDQTDNPFSQSIYSIKKWGMDAATPLARPVQPHPPHIQPSQLSSEIAQKKQALYEDSYGYFIELLSTTNNTSPANDEEFLLRSLQQSFQENPTRVNRAVQLTLETFFSKSTFELRNVKGILGEGIDLADIIGRNNGFVDQSSIFAAIQMELFRQSLTEKPQSIVIIETPTNPFKQKDLPPKTQEFMEESKSATGNSVCDTILNGHPYDIKILTDNKAAIGKNHIQPIEGYNTTAQTLYFKNMEDFLRQQTQENNDVPKFKKQYYEKVLNKFLEIKNEKSLSLINKIRTFTTFATNDLPNRPPGCTFSLLHITGDPSYTPNPDSEYARLARECDFPQYRKPTPSDVVKSNKIYTAKQNEETKDLIHKRTNGAYGSSSSNTNTSKDSYKDEVD